MTDIKELAREVMCLESQVKKWYGLEAERHDEYTRLCRLTEEHYDLYREARSEVRDLEGQLWVSKEKLKQMLGGDE